MTAAIFTPDGQTIVSASWDKTIRLWSVATGLTTRILTGHSKGVGSLAVSLNGRWLASGGEDATVRLWDLKTGLETRTFGGHRNSVTSVAFSPDGELLAAGCSGAGRDRLEEGHRRGRQAPGIREYQLQLGGLQPPRRVAGLGQPRPATMAEGDSD